MVQVILYLLTLLDDALHLVHDADRVQLLFWLRRVGARIHQLLLLLLLSHLLLAIILGSSSELEVLALWCKFEEIPVLHRTTTDDVVVVLSLHGKSSLKWLQLT